MNHEQAEKILRASVKDLSEPLKSAVEFTLEKFYTSNEDLPNEEWRDVLGYEGLYKVSNLGRVKSFFKGIEKFRKPVLARPGYFSVVLYKNNIPQSARIHVLVAQAFIPNPENKAYVNHIDGNKLNNRADNLEWVTPSENLRHAYDTGLQKSGCEHPSAKFTEEQIKYIRNICIPDDLEFGISALARKFNVSLATISRIVKYKRYKNVT